MHDTMHTVAEEENVVESTINVMDSAPLRKDFTSKAELERTDKARLGDYNMYWHLKEFDPIDIVETMDLDEKFKKKQKIEA